MCEGRNQSFFLDVHNISYFGFLVFLIEGKCERLNQTILIVSLMYLTSCIEPAERKEKLSLLRRVNEHLASNSHLAGAALTGADVLLFHSIHKIFSELTFQEKDKLMHLSRWDHTYVNWSALRIGRHCLNVFVKSCIKGFITNPF